MTRLSVNVNKVATLRNARGGNLPNLLQVSKDVLRFGANGLTVHPRPDARHVRLEDVAILHTLVSEWRAKGAEVEFNVEGYPNERFLKLLKTYPPQQATLVPDAPNVLTSNEGWRISSHKVKLKEVLFQLREKGIRSSLFVEAKVSAVEEAKEVGADCVELYTGPYAKEMAKLEKITGTLSTRDQTEPNTEPSGEERSKTEKITGTLSTRDQTEPNTEPSGEERSKTEKITGTLSTRDQTEPNTEPSGEERSKTEKITGTLSTRDQTEPNTEPSGEERSKTEKITGTLSTRDQTEPNTEPSGEERSKTEKTTDTLSEKTQHILTPYVEAARRAKEIGLYVNAGHDLNLDNVGLFVSVVPSLDEVSIGHALVCESLYYGLQNVVGMYLERIERANYGR